MKVGVMADDAGLRDFTLEGRQGADTYKRFKVPADGIRGTFVNPDAEEFLVTWFPQKSITLTYKRYSEVHAVNLALLWCHRMQYFYDYYVAFSMEDGFVFTHEVIASYTIEQELQEKLEDIPKNKKVTHAKIQKIMNMVPALRQSQLDSESE